MFNIAQVISDMHAGVPNVKGQGRRGRKFRAFSDKRGIAENELIAVSIFARKFLPHRL